MTQWNLLVDWANFLEKIKKQFDTSQFVAEIEDQVFVEKEKIDVEQISSSLELDGA